MCHCFCGLDFGTTNSAVGVGNNGGIELVSLEGENKFIPSAVFFDYESGEILVGQIAKDMFMQEIDGRLLTSLKTILGTSTMEYMTSINGMYFNFMDIIGIVIKYIKNKMEERFGHEIDSVVLGRPVFFVDEDREKDGIAQSRLEQVARDQGFKHIEFQYEPVAAALDYESSIGQDRIALVVDIGGGTSDFSIVRLSPVNKGYDRHSDILANTGIHIGGNGFDRLLSIKDVMPELGMFSSYRDVSGETMAVPKSDFHDLATWHRINRLYDDEILRNWKFIFKCTDRPEMLRRFLTVLEYGLGHKLCQRVEESKKTLSLDDRATADMDFIERDFKLEFCLESFNEVIAGDVDRLERIVEETIKDSGLKNHQIDTVFYTGGSTNIPYIRDRIRHLTPGAEFVQGDTFGSVATGLTIDARQKFS
ncbi:MAG: Hsp70 family protein [Proteobacteria bacterium]|nr:Hsp70 family protein [Pseudomonadota bacterium]